MRQQQSSFVEEFEAHPYLQDIYTRADKEYEMIGLGRLSPGQS